MHQIYILQYILILLLLQIFFQIQAHKHIMYSPMVNIFRPYADASRLIYPEPLVSNRTVQSTIVFLESISTTQKKGPRFVSPPTQSTQYSCILHWQPGGSLSTPNLLHTRRLLTQNILSTTLHDSVGTCCIVLGSFIWAWAHPILPNQQFSLESVHTRVSVPELWNLYRTMNYRTEVENGLL